MKPRIRLLALDIDGTLLDPGFQISAANLTALRRAHEAGVEIVLGTGRRHAFAMPVAEALGVDVWLISSNGAVTKSSRGEIFHCDLLPVTTARKLVEHMREYRGNTVLTFDREHRGALVVERTDELHVSISRWMEKNAQYIDIVIPIEHALTIDPIQMMFCGNIDRMAAATARLSDAPFVDDFTVLRTQYEARDLCIVDVLNRDCSKGHALRRWAEYRGYKREEVMAIGDNYNDLEMLEFAGIPFIMGNASDDLKQGRFTVTLRSDQSGVAAALEQVGL